MDRSLELGPAIARNKAGACGIEIGLEGGQIWFESRDSVLDDGIEAAAGSLLMPAAAAGRRLKIRGPVSAVWLANLGRMMEIWRRWWDYPVLLPAAEVLSEARPSAAGVALCFTGGVDSFHTLLCGPVKPDVLAFVHGYDIALDDHRRIAAFEPSMRDVAAAAGARAVLLRSNLRLHPLSAACDWEQSHGGAIAAIGHLLAGQVGTLLVSSSFPTTYGYNWGSHWQLDPYWSSDRLTVVHHGATHSRLGKVREIAGHELVQRHLRVCWENRAPAGNCSRCDKCLCTMALVASCGSTGRYSVFDWSDSLADRLGRLPLTRFILTYGELLESGPDRRLAAAIRSLLKRTAGKPTFVGAKTRSQGLLRRAFRFKDS
jgi:hypothetical protein